MTGPAPQRDDEERIEDLAEERAALADREADQHELDAAEDAYVAQFGWRRDEL